MLYWIVRFLIKKSLEICCKLEFRGLDNLPDSSCRYIIVSNHVSNYDPFAVGVGVPRKVHYIAKKELFDNPLTYPFVKFLAAFPVDREKVDRKAIKKALAVLKNGGVLGIFPEGGRSKDGKMKKVRGGAAYFSIATDSPIVPAAITGTKNALIRKFPPRWKKFIVKFGKPIYPGDFKGSKKQRMKDINQQLIEKILQLKEEIE